MQKFDVKELPAFSDWLSSLKDSTTKARLTARLRKVSFGLLGDNKSVGEGVFELREDFGPGWRMYFIKFDRTIIVMLGGGEKSTQQKDIEVAIALSKTLEK